MKKIIALALTAIMIFGVLVGCGTASTAQQSDNPADRAKTWLEKQIKDNSLFSFVYDGKAYAEHIKDWEKTVEEGDNAWTLTYKKDGVVAWSEITFDEEMAALEWTNYFKNEGSSDSLVISDILAIDSSVYVENPIFTSADGSAPAATDFQPFSVDLNKEPKYSMSTSGGRSSQGAWPYFDICNGEYGIIGAIGWTGDWKADFANHKGQIRISAGMQETKISLHADEQMRTPMIMLQFFNGDQDAGHNALRQLVLKSYTPSDESGEPIKSAMLFVSVPNVSGLGEEALINTAKALERSDVNYECFWIDAGWYGDYSGQTLSDGTWVQQVGNWYFIPSVYPNGNVQRLGEYLKSNDRGFLLWFEPERAMPGTKLTVEHPEWFIKAEQGGESSFMLLNLGIDEACDYIINWIGSTIKENHLTWYRQDFNCNPAERWRTADHVEGENRTGITEIKYITNEYRFLDGLIEMNPGLLIDNCASGGKRLDLEMMKRSVPLWHSDYTCDADLSTPDGNRALGYNLSWWLPIHAGGWPNGNSEDITYAFRTTMHSGISINSTNAVNSTIKGALFDQYYTCRELMTGDFYILDQGFGSEIETKDACYEFYKADEGKGYLVAFRPEHCATESASYRLKGLDAASSYELEVVDAGQKIVMTGEELMTDGLKLTYPRANISFLIYINKV